MQKTENFNTLEDLKDHLTDVLCLNEELVDGIDIFSTTAAYDTVEMVETDNTIVLACLVHDENPEDFFDNDEGSGKIHSFHSLESLQKKQKELSKEKKLFYLLDKYQHGNVHYSISGTKTYPDQQWDVSVGCSIYEPSDHTQEQYRKMKRKSGEAEAFKHFIDDSNATLNTYSDWCNGEVYGYHVATYDKKTLTELSIAECWGHIGEDNANKEKQSIFTAATTEQNKSKDSENKIKP